MNIPNLLTTARFIIIPFFGYALYTGALIEALLLFLLSGFTDILDGYIARKFNLITSWGKLADPLADKLIQITTLAVLTIRNTIPLVILVVVLVKELLMGLGSMLLYKKARHVVSSSWYGKAATVIFYLAIATVIVFDLQKPLSGFIAGAAVIPTLAALFMYYFLYYKSVNQDPSSKDSL